MTSNSILPNQEVTQSVDPRRWLALVVILTAFFMALLDAFIVNVAFPSIQNGLHASFAQVHPKTWNRTPWGSIV